MGEHDPSRQDVEALLETRRELGPSYDAALVDSFAERLERAVSERVEAQVGAQVAARTSARDARALAHASAGPRQLALAIVSVLACIPLSLALGLNGQGGALVLSLVALVAINLAHAWQGRGPA